ncbi:MAG TPA: hypothetical protein VM165_15985 [Planctomycetaceae bacterium]|nr:hypothetical protein [Planctomycetaceae bacterium]
MIVVEGVLDAEFLRHLSDQLQPDIPDLPDLCRLTAAGHIVWIPAGGGDLRAWTTRLAPLGVAEFHLYDREQEPETTIRQTVVDQIRQRLGCDAALTTKRALENYLHPAAIQAATGITIDFGDHDPVAERLVGSRPHLDAVWPTFTRRSRQRLLNLAKRTLNTQAVRHMTSALLAERDPTGEVLGWFQRIGALLDSLTPPGD